MSTSAAAMPRDYVAATRSFYDQMQSLCIGTVTWPDALAGFREWLSPMAGDTYENWKTIYRNDVRKLLGVVLRDLGVPEGSPLWQQVSNANFYDTALPRVISSYLLWIWEEPLTLTDSDQSGMVEAMIEGTIGYRLIDLHLDGDPIGPEAVVLGHHLVRAHECRLAAIFGDRTAWPILNRYAKMYAEVEFLEKSHRWKPCPFSWDQPSRIGWKGAPLTSVLHLMMDRAGKPSSHIEITTDAMLRILAVLQLMDDWNDAADDLANGTETLAASGFYRWNGDAAVTPTRVREFLDQPKMRRYVGCALELLNTAIQDLENADEPILVFNGELIKYGFLQRLVVSKPESAAGRG